MKHQIKLLTDTLDSLSVGLTKVINDRYDPMTTLEHHAKMLANFNEYVTSSLSLNDLVGICIIPKGHTILGGILNFGAMGASALLDLGIYGLDGNGRYDDTVDTTTVTTLVSGQYYKIVTDGGDAANVGAPDDRVGTIFLATGTTPTTASGYVRVGWADDVDFFLDGIDVSSAGQDTFADLLQGDSNAMYEVKKDVVVVAKVLGAAWADDQDLQALVKMAQL